MNLVVDAGNTRLKYAFFDDGELLEVKYRADDLFRDIRKWREERGRVDLLLSGSGDITEGMRATLKESVDWCVEASPLMPMPLKIGYATPETLGFDRIAICTDRSSNCC